MACNDCSPSYPVASYVFSGTAPCTNCDGDCPQGIHPTSCVYNDGPPLLCIGAAENERLDSILNKIDAALCTAVGVNPYPSYNTYCLGTMTNQQEFVETISEQFCSLQSAYNTFTGTTFPAAIDTINNTITALNTPNIASCAAIGYTSTDTLKTAITRLSNYACNLQASLSLTSVDWDQCSIVADPPETIQEGFDFVISQICNLSASMTPTLPTFDNTGSCLDTPTATDSLSATIIKIRSKLCTAPSYNPGSYTPGCFSISGATSLDTLLQSLVTQLSSVMQAVPRSFDPTYFAVSDLTPGSPCLGKEVTLTGVLTSDRLVALDSGDTTPGTLEDKVAPGSGITLDFGGLNAGKMTISAANLADEKVKAYAGDPSAGYLDAKLTGSSGAVVNISTALSGNQVQVSASVDTNMLVDIILNLIEEDEDFKARFCTLTTSCPSPCTAPSNVQAVAVASTTTTTTTSSTTTTTTTI